MGKVAAAPQVELHVWQGGPFRDPNNKTELKPADIAEFVATQLQSDLIHAIEHSAEETSVSNPPAILATMPIRWTHSRGGGITST